MSIKLITFLETLITLIHLSRGYSVDRNADCSTYQKYCKSRHLTHTMCKYKENRLGRYCLNAMRTGLTNDEKIEIVRAHNEYRQNIVNGGLVNSRSQLLPKADPSYMNELVWDNELAAIAQRWASQCTFDHDECKYIGPKEKDDVGQNIGLIYEDLSDGQVAKGDFDNVDISKVVYQWFIEYKMVEISEIFNYTGSEDGIIPVAGKSEEELQIGHFTQLAWGDTRKVGCGAQIYYEDNDGYNWLLVCNYFPIGNWIGKPVYKIDSNQNQVINEVIQV